MTKYESPGNIIPLTAPGGGVTSGTVYEIDRFVVVALADADAGETFQGAIRGIFNNLPCKTTDDVAQGDALYWDNGNSELTLTAAGNLLVGAAVEASGTSSSVVVAYLSGQIRPDEPT